MTFIDKDKVTTAQGDFNNIIIASDDSWLYCLLAQHIWPRVCLCGKPVGFEFTARQFKRPGC